MSTIREVFAPSTEDIDQLNRVIRSLAGVILSEPRGFDRVWEITNRVCERWEHATVLPPAAQVYPQAVRVA